MNMHSHRPCFTKAALFVSLLVAATCAYAQKQPDPKTPDQRFDDVAKLAAPVPAAKSAPDGTAKTPEQVKADIARQAELSRQAAQAAKEFYTQNPGHPKVAEARKIEALCTLRGVEAGNAAHEQPALAIGKAFREDKGLSAGDRFEVALAMDRLELSRRIKVRAAPAQTQAWVLMATMLRGEFGDMPELYTYYMDLARTADNAAALKLATEVNQSAIAPPDAKARAKVILERSSLLGKVVNLQLTRSDGGIVELARQSGRTTLLIVCSPADLECLDALKPLARMLPSDAQVVYLALGGSEKQVTAARLAAPISGWHCHAQAGPQSRSAIEALKLQYAPLPRLFVFGRAGTLVGFGRMNDLPSLFPQAAR